MEKQLYYTTKRTKIYCISNFFKLYKRCHNQQKPQTEINIKFLKRGQTLWNIVELTKIK